MRYTCLTVDASTGETTEHNVELRDVLSDAAAVSRDRALEIEAHNSEIKRQLDENDIKIVRAICDGDSERIAAHKQRQAELRAKYIHT